MRARRNLIISNCVAEALEPRCLLVATLEAQMLWRPNHPLSAPSTQPHEVIARAYLKQHASALQISPADVSRMVLSSHFTDELTRVTHLYFTQHLNGLPISGAELGVHVLPDGSILSIAGHTIATSGIAPSAPGISARRAVLRLAKDVGLPHSADIAATPVRGDGITALSAPALSLDRVVPGLHYVPSPAGLMLAWDLTLRTPDGEHWYNASVDATAGTVLRISDWVEHATYQVVPYPRSAPTEGATARLSVVDPHDPFASPFGWHDNDGNAGPEFTDSRGNNVFAQEDLDGNNIGGLRPNGSAALSFEFPLDLFQPPSGYTNAAVTNLFYWSNLLHDAYYRYGFDEAAGNFQTNNYGHGGKGNDALQADAQDGGSLNNASFATPPDGQAPRMQMALWNLSSPARDSSFDSQLLIHEYAHGVSSRLTGGAHNANALQTVQAAGMAEGWSDFFSLMLLQDADDLKTGAYPIGNYVSGQTTSGVGIRRAPYSFDMAINPRTIADYGPPGANDGTPRSIQVHDTGEIWASALWDMSWLLIDKYGFEPDVRGGLDLSSIRGNTLAMQLVMDGLKFQPANPTFSAARDAILQADQVLTAGANQSLIRAAFARRGMGEQFDAISTDSTSVVPDFTGPSLYVRSVRPVAGSLAPIDALDVHFSEPVDSASFSIANDVLSGGDRTADVLPRITGITWLDPTVARIHLTALQDPGDYSLTLGAAVLAADDGLAMDNDFDGTGGEVADDAYTATFSYRRSIGPDNSGLSAAAYPFEPIDLVAGQPGVVTLISQSRNLSSWINLGANTFNYYGSVYSGNAGIAASSHGLLTFAALNSAATNTDLRSSPSARAVAALWDDWRPDINVPGATNSAVLFKFEDATGDGAADRLIVEWSDVPHSDAVDGVVTFQAILELNTGSRPGRIILNYPDLDTGAAEVTAGRSATVGLKDYGPQGGRRLLVSQDSMEHPWIASGRAIVLGTDVIGPSVVAHEFEYQTSHKFAVQFSEDLGRSLSVSDWTMINSTTQQAIPASQLDLEYDPITRRATLKATAPLLDGDYEIRLPARFVTDADGNRMAGGDFRATFFVLAGDANRDRAVDVTDLSIVASNWQQSPRDFSHGDFNYDGRVDITDLALLATNWQSPSIRLPRLTTGFSSKSTISDEIPARLVHLI